MSLSAPRLVQTLISDFSGLNNNTDHSRFLCNSQRYTNTRPLSPTPTVQAQPENLSRASPSNLDSQRTSAVEDASSDPISSPIHRLDSPIYRWQGHNLSGPAPTDAVRLSFLNIHGLYTTHTPLSHNVTHLTFAMQTYDVSILGISEHHLPMQNPKLRHQLRDAFQPVQAELGGVTYRMDSSGEQCFNESHKLMGGTGLIITGESIGRIVPQGLEGDPMGRWSVLHLRRRRNLAPITVISIYQVCHKPTNVIGNTAWHQQRRALDMAGQHEIHPRHAFRRDLSLFVQSLQHRGHDIIIGGDWNDSLGDIRSVQAYLGSKFDLVDPWSSTFPEHEEFATYERGSTRIDSVLLSRRLLPSVLRIGYTPVGLLFNSDHRGLILEFSKKCLLGDDLDMLPSPPSRGIRSNDKKAVQTYIEALHSHLKANNAFRRGVALAQSQVPQGNSIREVEKLDRLVGEACTLAESRCRKRRSSWFSTPLARLRQEVSCLRFLRNGFKCGFDRTAVVSRKLALAHLPNNLPSSLAALQELLRQREEKLRDLVIKSRSSRAQYLQSTADTCSQAQQHRRALALRKINRHELAQATWQQLSFLTSKGHQRLDQLEIPTSWPPSSIPVEHITELEDPKLATSWKLVTDPAEIEQYLLLRNQLHFGQANGTPFTISPLSDEFDWCASTSSSDEVLQGTYVPPESVSELCKEVLAQCKATSPPDSVPATLTQLSFAAKITKWNEFTATSPSGRHLGHYKSLFSDGTGAPGSPALSQFRAKQSQIIQLIVNIINFCIAQGHVLQRWTQIVNVMIFKDPGNSKIHRLRVIHIYEADFNLLLAVKWRELLHFAERQGTINNGQYGGRPGREATSVALLEELRTDISYCTRRTLLTFDNDAASCYDRIIPSLASLINRKYGMHNKLALVHGRTLQEAQYKLKTAIGVSDVSYSHSSQFPIYGTGQGSGNSPMVWLFISATLFDVYSRHASGASFSDPTGQHSVRLTLSGYVDDTNAALNDWHPQHEHDLQTLLGMLQEDAQRWNDLLFISGGKLELSKCSFHVLSFDFLPDGTPRPRKAPTAPICIRDSVTGSIIQVTSLPPDKPHKILGHLKAPVGGNKQQLRAIVIKANSNSRLITTGPFTRYGAKLVYNAKYLAALQFVLPQCFFTSTQLKKAEKQSMPSIIAKCGFLRTSPQALLYAPIDYAGGGFRHWFWIQGEGQILHFIKHWRTNTDISRTLRISLAWSQWQSGLSQSILTDTTTSIDFVESRWIPSLRGALREFSANLTLDHSFVPPPERQGDAYIMEVAIQCKKFSARDLRLINYCRMYLHVTTISELFNAAGTVIMPHMKACERPPWFDPSVITVIQKKPSRHSCRMKWHSLCQIIESVASFKGWSTYSLRLRRETYVEYVGHAHSVYHWYHGTYWRCYSMNGIVGQYCLSEHTSWTPTAKSIPIDMKARVISTIYLAQDIPPLCYGLPKSAQPSTPQYFEEYVQTLPTWEQQLLQHIDWHDHSPFILMEKWFKFAANNTLYVVSDGSSFEGRSMSFGVIFGSLHGQIWVTIMGPALGNTSSHRAECTGCLAGAVFLRRLQLFTGRSLHPCTPVVTMSDNKGMIDTLNERATYSEVYANSTLRSDWDLLEETHQTYASLCLRAHQYEWVKGHQDSSTSFTSLPIEAQFNVQADRSAGYYSIMVESAPHPFTPLMAHSGCVLNTTTSSVHGKYSATLRREVAAPRFRHYLKEKHGWSEEVFNEVDWPAFRVAARNYVSTDVHLLKLVHDLLPTRQHKARFQPWLSASCLHCNMPETLTHLQLSHCNPVSQQFRTDLLSAIRQYFQRNHTPDDFQAVFIGAISEWLEPDAFYEAPAERQRLLSSQSSIGWHLLTRGFLSFRWRKLFCRTAHQAKWTTVSTPISQDPDDFLPHDDCSTTGSGTDDSSYGDESVDSHQTNTTNPESLLHDNSDTFQRTIDPTVFIAGLIKTIWLEVGRLWTHHLDHIHHTQHQKQSPLALSDVQSRIRTLYNLRSQVLHCHQDRYFPSDLDSLLSSASLTYLQMYLSTYQPLIMASINAAEARTQSQSQLSEKLTNAAGAVSQPTGHSALEEAPHRKRNRLRIRVLMILWIIRRTHLRR